MQPYIRQIAVLLFAQLISFTVFASDNTFHCYKVNMTGKVTDAKTGEPLVGATIFISDDKIGTVADAMGNYQLNNIPAGHHVVEVSYAGYSSIVEHVELNSNLEKNFALNIIVLESQEVIVTGVSGPINLRKASVPVSVIKKLNLLQNTSTNIIDALIKTPGVSQVSTGPSVSKPVIRGLSYNRIITINDGVRQEGQQWGDEHGIEIDELSVNKIEILKGPASMIYGSDAMGGVINIITNTPTPNGVVKGSVTTNYQSNNGLFALNANAAGNKNGFNWNVYGSLKSAGNYKNKLDGHVINSGFEEKNFGGFVGLNKSWGYSHIIVSSFNQDLGVIEGSRDSATGKFVLFKGSLLERIANDADQSSRNILVPLQRVLHNKIVSDNNFALDKSRLKLNIAYQNNKRKEFGNPEDADEQALFFDLKTLNYNIAWQLPETNEWHTTLGVNGMWQQNRNKGEEVLIPEYNLLDAGLFVFTQRFFKKATLSGGFRFDNRQINGNEFLDGLDVKFTAFKKEFSNFSGSLGISYEPGKKITLKANLARGFRAPTVAELSSNGTHEGTNRYEYGSLNLKSETSLQADAGIEYNNEHLSAGVSAFYNRINNFIFYSALVSSTGGDSLVLAHGELIQAFKFNQNNASLAGVEFSLDFHPHPLDWLHIENTFSLVRGKFLSAVDGSNNLPLIPAPRWMTELRGQFNKVGKNISQVYGRIGYDYTFRQNNFFAGYDTETATDAYGLLNIGMGGDIINKNKRQIASIHIALQNITNVAWQSHLSRLKYTDVNNVTNRAGVFNAGRNFSIKVLVPIQFNNKK